MRHPDEIDPPDLHRWLCLCRQLMAERPIDGAWLIDPRFVDGCAMRPGWNEDVGEGRPSVYLHVDPTTEHVHRTPILPEGVEASTVNIIRYALPADVTRTALWTEATRLAARLPSTPAGPGLRKPAAIMEDIARHGALRRDRGELLPLSKPIIAAATAGIDFRKANGPDPALRVARDYMRFACPGILARYVLSSLYEVCYATLPGQMNRVAQPVPTMLMRKAEDLANAAYRLYAGRGQYNVAGYFNSTYLASLCAGTLITMGSNDNGRLDRLRFSGEQRRRLAVLRQNADELNAHYLGPAFALPCRFGTGDILRQVRTMAQLHGKTPSEVAAEQCLHPGLVAVLAEVGDGPLDDVGAHARYAGHVAHLPSLDNNQVLEREAAALRVDLHACMAI